MMRAALFALVLTSASAVSVPAATLTGTPVPVSVETIEKFQYHGTQTRFGGVEFRGGLVVSSSEKKFGGLSGIAVLPGGREAIIVSDFGYLMLARLDYQGGRLSGISIPHLVPALPGSSKAIKRNDSEDLAIGANGKIAVALEEDHRQIAVRALRNGALGKPEFLSLPDAGRKLGVNKGIESLALIPGGHAHAGHLLAIGERPTRRSGKTIPCWIVKAGTCSIRKREGFSITAARFLPDGDLMILERSLAPGFDLRMQLRQIPAGQVGINKVMDGEIVMQADLSMQIDNMEGLGVHQDADGRTILTLVSDDNQNFFQRTLILQFALVGKKPS